MIKRFKIYKKIWTFCKDHMIYSNMISIELPPASAKLEQQTKHKKQSIEEKES